MLQFNKRGYLSILSCFCPIRETAFHPSNILCICDLSGCTILPAGKRPKFPLFEIRLLNLPCANPCSISFVVFAVYRKCRIFSCFYFVFFLCGEGLAGTRLSFLHSVAVVCIVVSFHNKISAASFALPEFQIQFQQLCEFQFQYFRNRTEFITDRHAVRCAQKFGQFAVADLIGFFKFCKQFRWHGWNLCSVFSDRI